MIFPCLPSTVYRLLTSQLRDSAGLPSPRGGIWAPVFPHARKSARHASGRLARPCQCISIFSCNHLITLHSARQLIVVAAAILEERALLEQISRACSRQRRHALGSSGTCTYWPIRRRKTIVEKRQSTCQMTHQVSFHPVRCARKWRRRGRSRAARRFTVSFLRQPARTLGRFRLIPPTTKNDGVLL